MIFIFLLKWKFSMKKDVLDKFSKMYAELEKKGRQTATVLDSWALQLRNHNGSPLRNGSNETARTLC
jgi:hypothetical protein